MYAVVRTGGKQYRVHEGRTITVERLPGEPGETVELRDVLLMADGEDVTVGTPMIAGARVVGTITEQGRSKKVIVFRYKAKTRARKKTGHRQQFTRLTIEDILAPGQEAKPKQQEALAEEPAEPAPKPRRRARTATAEAEAAPAATAAEAPEAAPEQESAAPKRRRRKAE